jgi:hypothetical protein
LRESKLSRGKVITKLKGARLEEGEGRREEGEGRRGEGRRKFPTCLAEGL